MKTIYKIICLEENPLRIPFFQESVSAGFPSPAQDYIENSLDLNELMIKHPSSTFFVRVQGDSMRGAGIFSSDILVVDRSLEAVNGKIIVAIVNGEFTVKRLVIERDRVRLVPANALYSAIDIHPDLDFQVWGVVTYVIHRPQ
jgi:DNA polymerase V